MKKTVITDFSIFENDELDEKGAVIDELTTANEADLGSMPVSPAVYHGHLSTFSTILGKAIYPEKTADLRAAKKVLLEDLRKNGVHFNEFADGDETILAKTGYPFAKDPSPIGRLAQGGFRKITPIRGGFEGELTLVPNARGYIVCAIPTSDLTDGTRNIANKYGKWPWYHFPNTKFKIDDLDYSIKHTLVTCAVGTDPSLNYSDPIERTTQ